MKRATVFGLVAVLWCLGRAAYGAAPAEKSTAPPNFVFILIDDLGWRDLGCFGSKLYETPHVDRLAREGMKFTNAYACCHVCSPTRASILTGKYPARLHLTDYLPGRKEPFAMLQIARIVQHLPHEEITLPEALKPLGYASTSIGKWHLGGEGSLPTDHGFDSHFGGCAAGHHRTMFFPYVVPDVKEGRDGEYLTDRLTDEALKFIDANRDEPFLLYLPHYAVHRPIEAKADRIARYQAKITPGDVQQNAAFAAMIDSVNESTGRLMARLKELGIDGRTVVIFMSDNGSLRRISSPAPLRLGKGTIYEGGLRVPLIVKWPGVTAPGSVCGQPVISIDFFPTILEIAGAPAMDVDGVSLVPLLEGAKSLRRDAIYWHYPHYSNNHLPPCGAIRQGDFKLIEFYEGGQLQLYNLKDDVGETHNLAQQLPEKAAAMRKQLDQWRQSVGAQSPQPNPDYDPAKTRWNRRGDRMIRIYETP